MQTVGDILAEMDAERIVEPGIYPGIDIEAYHGREICPAPSISSSGLKLMRDRSPLHYWWQSPLNPNREEREDKRQFRIGKAVHDRLLLGERWPAFYHLLPEGFSRAKSKAMADDIEAADAAVNAGKVLLSPADMECVNGAVASIRDDKALAKALERGEAESTVAWQDGPTQAWLRARPDCMSPDRSVILDIKTAEDASPRAMERAIKSYGYLMAAALYLDGIEAVTGERPKTFMLVAVEKSAPYAVACYPLDSEDIRRAAWHYNRPTIDQFARCVATGEWPSYPAQTLGMAEWERRALDKKESEEADG